MDIREELMKIQAQRPKRNQRFGTILAIISFVTYVIASFITVWVICR